MTGKELDKGTLAELRTLEAKNAERVAQHLVMAGRYLDEDPRRAFEHASAAAQSGGRVSLVREAVGVAAYAAGEYAAALRELRTFRRISGSNIHLPLMADSERGLGRPEKALELARSEEASSLDTSGKVEMAIVAAGALGDLERFDEALAALEVPQLDLTKGFSFSPRLFRAYGEALTNVGREGEADTWFAQAVVAERALGIADDEDDVEFYDVEEDLEDEETSLDGGYADDDVDRGARTDADDDEASRAGTESDDETPSSADDAETGSTAVDPSAPEAEAPVVSEAREGADDAGRNDADGASADRDDADQDRADREDAGQ
ncbi:hypothetical protein GCM10009595_02600 [Falsarthrobacter nasiphocae]